MQLSELYDINNSEFKKSYFITSSGAGFIFKITFDNELMGYMDVEDIMFPNYMESYLELSKAIMIILGIMLDKGRLMQVLSNLIGNAFKFTEKGKIQVSVDKVEDKENKVKLMFSVKDTGIGIKEEDIPRLFNYFTQLDISASKKFQGTGLGLAISKNIVELMGGEISVESQYGKGSTFYFTCLFDIANDSEESSNIQKICMDNKSHPETKILQVEDDIISQRFMNQLCKIAGWKIKIASNGLEALNILENEDFDIILMDIQMPDMSGIELTKIIREKEKLTGKHITIIAMTAYAMGGDRDICINTGMDDYISKPIEVMKLKEVITKYSNNYK